MKPSMKNLFFGVVTVGCALLLGACAGYVGGGPDDYYGPVYGGAVFYGHPYYGGDHFWGGPGGRRWR